MRKILFVLAVFAFTIAVPVYAADNDSGTNVSGTWVLTMMNPKGGEDTYDVVITQDGERLNVTTTVSELQVVFSGTGHLLGRNIKFSLKGPDNQLESIFEGEVTGKKMEGTREIRDDRDSSMKFLPPPSGGGGEFTDDEIESFNTWSAVMK